MKDRKPLETRIVSIDSLVPHPRNFKIHPQKQIKKLIADIKRFGQVKPIVIQAGPEGNIIVAGHGFTDAAKQAGLTELSAVVLPPTWSSDDAVGYLVSDNETERDSEIDETALAELLEEQKNAGFDLASLGFDEGEFANLVQKLGDEVLEDGGGDEEEGGGEIPGLNAPDLPYENKFAVAVVCESEEHQKETFDRLVAQGYTCKVLVV